MSKIRVGSRGSKLALWQTEWVIRELQRLDDKTQFEKVVIKTKGDKLLDVALSRIGDKGLFTKEIESKILDGSIDMAVHSMKDVPTTLPQGLTIGAIPIRENPGDVLLSFKGASLKELPTGARIGTSSLRRKAQLRMLRSDLNLIDLRGNINTRVKRMREMGLDGIVLAYAGVIRMGFEDLIVDELEFLPAVGQGAMGIELRENDQDLLSRIVSLDDPSSHLAVKAERAFLKTLEGGCQVPIGALARFQGEYLELEGMVSDLEGKRVFRDQIRGLKNTAEDLGRELAENLLCQGADRVLKALRNQESI